MTSNDLSYIAGGFHEDCVKLLELFKLNASIRFDAFCKAWQEMKFSLVFLCRKSYSEMLEFCEESLRIAKQLTLTGIELVDQVGALYLLYGLYYKIPVENVKIRVTFKEWQMLLYLHQQIKEEKLHDASFIFVKLVTDNAFHHCLFSSEYGLEKMYKSRHDLPIDNPYSVLPNIVDETGNFSKIQDLSKIYDEQKTKLLNDISSKNKLQLFDKSFMDEILDQVDALQEKRESLSGLRRKVKEITANGNEKPEKKYIYEDRIRPKLGHGFDTDSSDDENMDREFTFVNINDQSLPNDLDYIENENVSTKQEVLNEEFNDNIIL